MYIEPNTVILILKDCPLDTTYEHTIHFESPSAQESYFKSLKKHTLDKQSYQRVNRGYMRVSIPAEDLYDCNYLMFKNTSFENSRWFYAFIKSVEYINNLTSEIEFELDVMQSWYWDYNLGKCFVEREHTATDVIGEHTVPEGLETGPYITTASSHLTVDDLGLYVMSTEKLGLGLAWNNPGIVGGFPIPCYWMSLGSVREIAVDVLTLLLDAYASEGKADSIVAVFTAPRNMVSTTPDVRVQSFPCATRTLSKPNVKNNKLYTYPYCCLTANALGQGVEMRYELFGQSPTMTVSGGFGANMQVVCAPLSYAGQAVNLEYSLSIKDFPVCAWVTDYFQNWLAQNKASIAVNTLHNVTNGAIGAGLAITTGGVLGLGQFMGGVNGIMNQMATVQQHSIIPDKMVGSANAADILAVTGKTGFYTFCKSILPEYIDIIDNFFNRYGYKVNTVKTPNTNVRPHWTYTKTHDCALTGSVPSDDMKKIASIYDNGVTFWRVPSEIGDYTLDNSV